jgi:hypothetical protein
LILKKTILKIYNELKIFYNERVDEIKFTYEIFKEVSKSLNSEYKRFKNYNKSSSFKSKDYTWHKKFTEEYKKRFGGAYTDSDLEGVITALLKLMNGDITSKKLPWPIQTIIKSLILNLIVLSNVIFISIKWMIIPSIISIFYFFISLFYIQIDLTKQIALWYFFGISYYLLISSFNSFLIKYKYGKFTSAIQRFWKRTGVVFWLIESFLFLLFFCYFLNSSQEPLYMFDYSNLNQELLIQLKTTYKNLILLSLAIYISFILVFNLNYLQFNQNIILLLLILLIIFYSLYIETYQFIYVISLFGDKIWLFEDISQSWSLEIEQNTSRVKQQYFAYCLIAKYWHFIFIFISWFFFFVKALEIKKISYTMLGYNTQNLLIIYVLNFVCLIQWLKFVYKRFLEITYPCYHYQYDEKTINQFYIEFLNILQSFFIYNLDIEKKIIISWIKSIQLFVSDNLHLWKLLEIFENKKNT